MRSSKIQWMLLAACFLLYPLGASAETPDEERVWTTVGSAGTLDDKSEGKVVFDHAVVQKGDVLVVAPATRQIRTDGTTVDVTDSAVIRYNVTAVDGLFTQAMIGMKVRFLDEGGSARVVAQLIEVDIDTGAKVTRLTFDSDAPDVPVQGGYRMHEVFACSGRSEAFDFLRKAYYIEATLTTSSIQTNSAAGIEIIQLYTTPCGKF
jgi:hypothetical protein